MRKAFATKIHELMSKNKDLFFLTGDLGMYVLDDLKRDFPTRFINVGAAEQAMLDTAVGLSLGKKRVITYTISPFYLRAFETIRTYIDHENIPILMASSGQNQDYPHDGFSHDASDMYRFLGHFENLTLFVDNPDIERMLEVVDKWYTNPKPTVVFLKK